VKATGLVQSPVEKKIACPAPMVEKACAVVGKQRACVEAAKLIERKMVAVRARREKN
jgi:hypothetical protein